MNPYWYRLKAISTAKTLADLGLIAAVLISVSCYALLETIKQELDDLLLILAVIIYSGMAVLGFCLMSLIARGIFLYRHPQARTFAQKCLLAVAALPFVSLLVRFLVAQA